MNPRPYPKFDRSREIFARAVDLIPGGVNSPVRAYNAVGGEPVAIARGKGSRVWDADGNEYIDYVCSWGPLILGHAPEGVVRAVCEAAEMGTSFGALTEREVEFAQLLCEAVPCLENGVMLAPSQFEAAFISLAHSDSDIETTVERTRVACKEAASR